MRHAALAPLFDPKLKIIVVLLRKESALVFAKLRAARDIGKNGVFDYILMDRLDQGIVGHGLHEDGSVIMPGRSGNVDLKRKLGVFLQKAEMYVLDRLKPCHPRIVNVVGFVIEDCEFFHFSNNFTKVSFAFIRLPYGLYSKWIKKVVSQVIIL